MFYYKKTHFENILKVLKQDLMNILKNSRVSFEILVLKISPPINLSTTLFKL